ncbi:hypothetical protein AB0F71_11940 [Kitasatospora sp. NPDC028055]|uniref:hypothetical protein n=1 Tax=Kitasatospora sp. NPDC028055 TaxID=3155653 RepID=UPI0033DF5DF9
MAVDGSNMAHAVIETAVKERTRLQTGRSRATALVVLVLLAGLGLFLALVVGKPDPSSAPDCDGQTMTRQNTCQIISNRGGGGTFSYDEMIDRRESGKGVWQAVGFIGTGLSVVLMGVAISKLNPNRPWGKQVDAACPRCHQLTLREKLTVHTISRGRTNYRYSGIVTLCTPVCGFTAVRQR